MGAPARELVRLATAGSVDDGKSTLIGRLLHDTGSLPLDHLEGVRTADGGHDLAALSDGLRAEREQGITIDVAYRYFSTARRSFVLADTPGHERYTRNMFTGASTAHVAVLLVDARAGVLRQTRRHARIASLLAVPHLVAAVNKMDLVGWDEARFEAIAADLRSMAAHLGGVGSPDLLVVPISALAGDNVVHRSPHARWYGGPTLLEHLEAVEVAAAAGHGHPLRLPVQAASRPEAGRRRRYSGRMASGALAVGDAVVVLPSGASTTVIALDTLDDARAVAVPPLSVSVELADELDVGRGDMVVGASGAGLGAGDPPVLAREVDVSACWMAAEPLREGDRVLVKHTTRTVRATVVALHRRVDPETLAEHERPEELRLNDIGVLTLRTAALLLVDPYARNRETGALILVDEHTNETVGAGTVLQGRPADVRDPWAPGARRATPVGATVWLTGPPERCAAVAAAVQAALLAGGRAACVLDGTALRRDVFDDLPLADAGDLVRRLGHLARVVAGGGAVAVVAAGDPADPTALALHEGAGLRLAVVDVAAGAPDAAVAQAVAAVAASAPS
jgi:bifunctional enzyme CysN/CysC